MNDIREEDPTPITPAVRSYSLKVEKENPEDPLSQSLGSTVQLAGHRPSIQRVKAQEWVYWLQNDCSSDPIFDPLEQQRKELIRVWQEFQRLFVPPGDLTSGAAHSPLPSIATLQAAVNDARLGWEAKHESGVGLARNRLLRFMETMDDHSFLFKFVPAEDKYISLLTGVVASVVKASVNYQKIAEGFSLALVEMSENLRFVQKKTQVANTNEMQRLVVALYVQVFKFLCHAMSFFHKRHKRFLASFNKGFYDKTVKAMVDGIQKTIGDIRNEAQHTTELRIEHMHQKMNDMEPLLVRLQQLGVQTHADTEQQVNVKLAAAAVGFQRLGENAVHQLEGVEDQVTHGKLAIFYHPKPIKRPRGLECAAGHKSPSQSVSSLLSCRLHCLSRLPPV
ncbi:Putative protein of unknown function [Podospora comata]|uniref:DUF7708 domain-containing protein n=1 Tax=Podospora comata TaxID=48703 RepID=A0ABY6RZF0_PODCO|nr:Putative protein of unknown function [Podospora comata]